MVPVRVARLDNAIPPRYACVLSPEERDLHQAASSLGFPLAKDWSCSWWAGGWWGNVMAIAGGGCWNTLLAHESSGTQASHPVRTRAPVGRGSWER